jgi:hypothetical protein
MNLTLTVFQFLIVDLSSPLDVASNMPSNTSAGGDSGLGNTLMGQPKLGQVSIERTTTPGEVSIEHVTLPVSTPHRPRAMSTTYTSVSGHAGLDDDVGHVDAGNEDKLDDMEDRHMAERLRWFEDRQEQRCTTDSLGDIKDRHMIERLIWFEAHRRQQQHDLTVISPPVAVVVLSRSALRDNHVETSIGVSLRSYLAASKSTLIPLIDTAPHAFTKPPPRLPNLGFRILPELFVLLNNSPLRCSLCLRDDREMGKGGFRGANRCP